MEEFEKLVEEARAEARDPSRKVSRPLLMKFAGLITDFAGSPTLKCE